MPHFTHEHTLDERLWDKVRIGDGCWEWAGALSSSGYGVIGYGSRIVRATRAVMFLETGVWAERRVLVCHRCDNRLCVRPSHLFLGTHQDNMTDARDKGRMRGPTAPARGVAHGNATITDEQVRGIRAARAEGATFKAIGQRFGISPAHAYTIATRRGWRHVS